MTASEDAGDGKADFGHLYNQPDPREYYRELGRLEYQIPQLAMPVFDAVKKAQAAGGQDGQILDVCCSYGINAALLTTDLTEPQLHARYGDPAFAELEPESLAQIDTEFYAQHRLEDAPEVVGLDISAEAVAYACATGLMADGWVANLEEVDPDAELIAGMDKVSMMMITGGVGYVTEKTFGRLLTAFPEGRKPWIAAFVLRMYSYDEIADTFAQHGLVTEKLPGKTFRQRRFASPEEQSAAITKLHEMGLDTAGLEDDGWFHCDLFLSRPPEDAENLPLADLLAAHQTR